VQHERVSKQREARGWDETCTQMKRRMTKKWDLKAWRMRRRTQMLVKKTKWRMMMTSKRREMDTCIAHVAAAVGAWSKRRAHYVTRGEEHVWLHSHVSERESLRLLLS
jgi:hypothetical protein